MRKGGGAFVLFVLLALLLGSCSLWGDQSPTENRPAGLLQTEGPEVLPPGEGTPVPTPTAPTPELPALQGTVNPQDSGIASLQTLLIALYQETSPSVVNVTSRITAQDPFGGEFQEQGIGSGFFYDDRGHIVTNFHVVEGANLVQVTLTNGEIYTATIVGVDPSTDLAVLEIDISDQPPPLPLADSSTLQVGQVAIAIGSPFGLEETMTFGIISSLGRVIESPDERFIGEVVQTDAAINPGNSGGPLLDLEGRVVGVNAQIASPTQSFVGIGFAVSSNTVRRVVPQLIATGRYLHPWLGVRALALTPAVTELLREAGASVPSEGLLLLEVVPGSPADAAGLRAGDQVVSIGGTTIPVGGDVLLSINGQQLETIQDLVVYLETQAEIGDTVEITFLRDGEQLTTEATLTARPEEPEAAESP